MGRRSRESRKGKEGGGNFAIILEEEEKERIWDGMKSVF